jgi:hypothetical protein
MQRAFEAMFERLCAGFDGARFERRSDLIISLCPRLPIPQCNGAWVVEDSRAAVAALGDAVAEVEAVGVTPWVQTRSGHDRTRRQAVDLGLTQSVHVPGMMLRPGDRAECDAEIEIGLVGDADVDGVEQRELFDIVRRAGEEATKRCLPGTEFRDIHRCAQLVVAEGLAELGLLRGGAEELVESEAVSVFFPHGVGHLVGLGVRDAGEALPGRERDAFPPLRVDCPS